MRCPNCGKERTEEQPICPSCGAQIEDPSQGGVHPDGDVSKRPSPKRISRKVWASIAAVIIVVAVVIVCICCLGGGYRKPIRDLVDGINERDDEKILAATVPEDVMDMFLREMEIIGEDEDELARSMVNRFFWEFMGDDYHLLDLDDADYTVSYTIVSAEKVDDDELEYLEAEWYYDYSDAVDIVTQAGRIVTMEIILTVDGEGYEAESEDILVVKVNGSWYIPVI